MKTIHEIDFSMRNLLPEYQHFDNPFRKIEKFSAEVLTNRACSAIIIDVAAVVE